MPTGKRASMREGPLAALFRKTTEETPPEAKQSRPPKRPPEPEREPATSERGAAPREDPPPHVPTPQERLRHAFSADIPHNLLERERTPEPDVFARPERPLSPFTAPSYTTSERFSAK